MAPNWVPAGTWGGPAGTDPDAAGELDADPPQPAIAITAVTIAKPVLMRIASPLKTYPDPPSGGWYAVDRGRQLGGADIVRTVGAVVRACATIAPHLRRSGAGGEGDQDMACECRNCDVPSCVVREGRSETAAPTVRLVVFDVDGTLVTTKSGKPFRQTPDDWEFLPGRQVRVRDLLAAGVKVAIATNQGSVAFGLNSEGAIRAELERTFDELVGTPDNSVLLSIAFNHPRGKVPGYDHESPMRKPGGGMITRAMTHFGIPASATLMVGDRPEDRAAASAAGSGFEWADAFFPAVQAPGCACDGLAC